MKENLYNQFDNQNTKDFASVLTPRELIYRHMNNPFEPITDEVIQNLKLDIYDYEEGNTIKRSWNNSSALSY